MSQPISPAIITNERFVVRQEQPTGYNVLVTGFTSEGVANEPYAINNITDYESLFGKPDATRKEQIYAYDAVKKISQEGANVIFVKLPYGEENGYDVGENYSALVFPSLEDTSENLEIVSYTANSTMNSESFLSLSGTQPFADGIEIGDTLTPSQYDEAVVLGINVDATGVSSFSDTKGYVFGEPVRVFLSEEDYENVKCGQISWSDDISTFDTSITGYNPVSFGKAGMIILDEGRSKSSDTSEGYYITVADNRDGDPATNWDAVKSIKTSFNTDNTTKWDDVSDSLFDFNLTTPFTDSDSSISQSITALASQKTNLPWEDKTYQNWLNVSLWRLTKDVRNGSDLLVPSIVESHTGSISEIETVIGEGGLEKNQFIGDIVEGSSSRLFVAVNPKISKDQYVDTKGEKQKNVSMYSISNNYDTPVFKNEGTVDVVGLTNAIAGSFNLTKSNGFNEDMTLSLVNTTGSVFAYNIDNVPLTNINATISGGGGATPPVDTVDTININGNTVTIKVVANDIVVGTTNGTSTNLWISDLKSTITEPAKSASLGVELSSRDVNSTPLTFFGVELTRDLTPNGQIGVKPAYQFGGVDLPILTNNLGNGKVSIGEFTIEMSTQEQAFNGRSYRSNITVTRYKNDTGLQSPFPPLGTFKGTADAMFSVSKYTPKLIKSDCDVGNIPAKIASALCTVDNPDRVDIDVSVEAGLGTIWTTVKADSKSWLKGTPAINSYCYDDCTYLDVVGDLGRSTPDGTESGNLRDSWMQVYKVFDNFNKYTRVGNGGNYHLHVADPLRQIVVNGCDCKVYSSKSKCKDPSIFATKIYHPLKNLTKIINSSTTTIDAQWYKVNNVYASKPVWVPSSPILAGLFAKTNLPWQSVAGVSRGIVTDVVDIAIDPVQRDRDSLWKIHTNAIYLDKSSGFLRFADQTMLKNDNHQLRQNSARRLMIWLEKNLRTALKPFLFEPNNLQTRIRFKNEIELYLRTLLENGAVEDYVVSLSRNNATSQQEGCLIADIAIKITGQVDKIILNFDLLRLDQPFQEIL
mgnify:CR=1 FL=1